MARNAKDLIPFVATHPGSILKEELEARGISQKEFAKRIGILPPNLNDVLHGRRNVTEQLAMKLEEALGIPFQSWINLQSRYNYLIHKGVPASVSEAKPSPSEGLKKQILAQFALITDDDAALSSCLKYMKNLVRQSKQQQTGVLAQEPPATYK